MCVQDPITNLNPPMRPLPTSENVFVCLRPHLHQVRLDRVRLPRTQAIRARGRVARRLRLYQDIFTVRVPAPLPLVPTTRVPRRPPRPTMTVMANGWRQNAARYPRCPFPFPLSSLLMPRQSVVPARTICATLVGQPPSGRHHGRCISGMRTRMGRRYTHGCSSLGLFSFLYGGLLRCGLYPRLGTSAVRTPRRR